MDIRLFNIKNLFKQEETFSWYFVLIYALIIAIPFNHKEAFSIYDPDLVWSKYILATLAVIGAYFLVKNFKSYAKDPFFVFFVSFAGFQILSLLQSGDITSSLRLIGFQLAVAFTYIPVRNFIYERKNGLKDLLLIYMLVFIPVLAFLAVQIYLQTNYKVAIGGVWPVPAYPTRYGATFWDINHFGAFCSALILILIGFLFQKGIGRKTKILAGSVLVAGLISLSLTGSRSSAIGFVFGLVTIVILYFNRFKVKIKSGSQFGLSLFAVIGGVAGFLYLLSATADSLKASLLYRSISFFSHLFLLKVGIIVGIQNFLLGIGANSFHAYFGNTEWADIYYYIDRAAMDLKLPLHNLWLEVLAETGLVSLAVFLLFWAVLLVGLYRVYRSENDYISLGLIGALTSFLIAGFMYSYKSEFFWLFVLIAAAHVSQFYFRKSKSNVLMSIKHVLCPENCDIVRISLIGLSVFILLVPTIFLTHPLNKSEIMMFNIGFEPNIITSLYMDLLLLFKYIIGNYTYAGRVLSFIFYSGSVALSFLILKRYLGGFYSLIITSLLFGIANIFEPNLIVSIKFYVVFVMLAIVGIFIFLLSLINRNVVMLDIPRKIVGVPLVILLLVMMITGLALNNGYFAKSYNTDLTFLSELAYNRRLMDKSLIQVSDDIDLEFVYYFSDEVVKKDNSLHSQETDVMPAERVDFTFYPKNLFIFTDGKKPDIYRLVEGLRGNERIEFTELEQGDYNILQLELKPKPADQLQ